MSSSLFLSLSILIIIITISFFTNTVHGDHNDADESYNFEFTLGTVEPSLEAFKSNFNLTSISAPTTSNSHFHIHMFEPLPSSSFDNFMITSSPICIASNVSGDAPIEFTPEQIGRWMRGTANNESVQAPRSTTVVTTDYLKLVLASNSKTTRMILRALVQRNVIDFTSETTLPASVLGNADILFVADDDAVASTIKSNLDHVGFLPVGYGGDALPCAAVRVLDSFSKERVLTRPRLVEADASQIAFNFTDFTIRTETSTTYPFIGPIFMSLPKSATCFSAQASSAIAFATRLFADSTFSGSLTPWGMILPTVTSRLTTLRHLVELHPCSSTLVISSGGASAPAIAVASWVLSYMLLHNVFFAYEVEGSGAGIAGVKSRQYRFAGSDSLFSEEERQQFPDIQFFPITAFGISVVANIAGVQSLTLPRCDVVKIFDGTITKWNDPRIQRLNPATSLPNSAINVVARSTRSGTTESFTRALRSLDLICTGQNTSTIEASGVWNLPVSFNASSTSDVIDVIQSTSNTLSYIATPEARQIGLLEAIFRDEKTRALTSPTVDLASVGFNSESVLNVETGEVDLSNIAASNPAAYPFLAVSYLVASINEADAKFCRALKEVLRFLEYIQTDEGADRAARNAEFLTVSEEIKSFTFAKERGARCNGELLFPPPAASPELNVLPIVLGTVIPGFILSLIGVFLLQRWFTRRTIRSTEFAVENSDNPFAIVTVDLENATLFWSFCPQTLPLCIDIYHQTIADVAEKYEGYQSRTISDCVTLVFKNCTNAVKFANELHRSLQAASWPELDDIDAAIIEWVTQDISSPYYQHPDLKKKRMDRSLFAGLAARVGIQLADSSSVSIKRDSNTEQYEYSGLSQVVSGKCCQLAHGGQTVVTGSLVKDIVACSSPIFDKGISSVQDLGKQKLRGLQEITQLYEVLPTELANRKFPPVRLNFDEEDFMENNNNNSMSGGMLNMSGFNNYSEEHDHEGDTSSEAAVDHFLSATDDVSSRKSDKSSLSGAKLKKSSPSLQQQQVRTNSASATAKMKAEEAFAEILCRLNRMTKKTSVSDVLTCFEELKLIFSTFPSTSKKNAIISEIVRNWRLNAHVNDSRLHSRARAVLGFESYSLITLAAKVVSIYARSPLGSKKSSSEDSGSRSSGGQQDTATASRSSTPANQQLDLRKKYGVDENNDSNSDNPEESMIKNSNNNDIEISRRNDTKTHHSPNQSFGENISDRLASEEFTSDGNNKNNNHQNNKKRKNQWGGPSSKDHPYIIAESLESQDALVIRTSGRDDDDDDNQLESHRSRPGSAAPEPPPLDDKEAAEMMQEVKLISSAHRNKYNRKQKYENNTNYSDGNHDGSLISTPTLDTMRTSSASDAGMPHVDKNGLSFEENDDGMTPGNNNLSSGNAGHDKEKDDATATTRFMKQMLAANEIPNNIHQPSDSSEDDNNKQSRSDDSLLGRAPSSSFHGFGKSLPPLAQSDSQHLPSGMGGTNGSNNNNNNNSNNNSTNTSQHQNNSEFGMSILQRYKPLPPVDPYRRAERAHDEQLPYYNNNSSNNKNTAQPNHDDSRKVRRVPPAKEK